MENNNRRKISDAAGVFLLLVFAFLLLMFGYLAGHTDGVKDHAAGRYIVVEDTVVRKVRK